MSQKFKALDKTHGRGVVVTAGALAGVSEIVATYPLDTIKTVMQIHPGKYRGMVSCGVGIIKEAGPGALYAGLGASVAQVGGKVALRFTAFDFLKGFFKDVEGKVSPVGNLAAGTMAGAIEAVVWTCPTERVKVLQQNNAGRDARFNTTIGTVRAVIAQGGVASLWVGTIPSMLKQSASVGTRFWLYNLVRERIVKPGETPAHWQTMLSGAAVGGASTIVNHPFDVVKSRMQAHDGRGPNRYKGTIQGLRLIAKEDGLAACMKGLSPRFTRVAMAQAITFTVYETFLSWIAAPSAQTGELEMQVKLDALQVKLKEAQFQIAERDRVIGQLQKRIEGYENKPLIEG